MKTVEFENTVLAPITNLRVRYLRAAQLLRGLLLVAFGTSCWAGHAEDQLGKRLTAGFIWTGQADVAQRKGGFVAFRKTITIADTNKPVTLHLFADARYVLWVNGDYVQRGPNRFEPQAPEYDSMDITAQLRPGSNSLVVLVASRISNGRVRMHAPGLTMQLEQGGKTLDATDPSWKWSSKIRYQQATTDWPNIYDWTDFRADDGDWTQHNYDDSAWAAAQPIANPSWGALTASRIPLLRETVVTPTWATNVAWPVTLPPRGEVGFKFSRLVLAYAELEVEATEDSEFEVVYLPETSMGRGAGAVNKFKCRAGRQTFLTTDTHSIFHGKLRVKSGQVIFHRVKFVERLYPFERLGSFESSDAMLNKLWTTCVRGLEIVSEDAYVDCTDRERVEWMDCDPPVFDVTRVAMAGRGADGKLIYADPRLLEVMLRRTAYTIQPEGWVKAHTSSDRFDIHAKMEDRACDWVQGARRYYESCGKTDVIREIWPMIVKQMNYFLGNRSPRGLVVAREWVVWGNPVGYQTCEGTALNAFVYRALADAAFLGKLIGEKEQAKKFDRAAAALAKAINEVLWDEKSGSYHGGYYELAVAKSAPDFRPLRLKVENNLIEPTRHAALFALDQGIVPAKRQASVTKFLFAHPPRENDIMQYYYFFKQQYAADDAAQDLAVLNKQRAEWRDMAHSPFEATFEGLHSWGSQAHCYGMFPAYFLSSYVLGVRLDGPVQNKALIIEPRLADLTNAAGTVVTEFGPVTVSWQRVASEWRFTVDTTQVAAGITVQLRLPVGEGKSVASLNNVDLLPSSRVVRKQGRWLTTTLPVGVNHGWWRSELDVSQRPGARTQEARHESHQN